MFFRFSPGISLSAKGYPRPKWPKPPVSRDFPPLGVQSSKTENVKKLRNFGEKLLGRPDFFVQSASTTGKLRFSVFRPEFLQVPTAVLGQNGLKSSISQFPAPGGPVSQNLTQKKLRNFGEKLLGRPVFFLKSASTTGKLRFSVFRPEFL